MIKGESKVNSGKTYLTMTIPESLSHLFNNLYYVSSDKNITLLLTKTIMT